MKFEEDLTTYGLFNIIIGIVVLVMVEYLLKTKSVMFDGFENIHYILWYGTIIFQLTYIYLILSLPEKYAQSRFGKNIYNLFTTGGYRSIKDVFIHSEEEPIFEYLMLLVFMLIPWPIFKKITMKHRITLLLSKIGLFHLISTLILLDWETYRVNLEYNFE
tara:strand:- start:4836 stop:5318 length:483 start_codon:yes stop_codon:yes gene_type:complete